MSRQLQVHLLPALIEADALHGGTAVIIDILRASSTMITALQNGASRVIPCGTTDQAFQLRDQASPASCLLGGERGGVRIEGFDFGNSPAEYTTSAVSGRTVLFTTTNGTKAILQASSASTILIGAFLNRAAIISRLRNEQCNCHLVCAGTDGIITGEDVLFAGAVVDGLMYADGLQDHGPSANPNDGSPIRTLNDSAVMAWSLWRKTVADRIHPDTTSEPNRSELCQILASAMRATKGGRNLISLGYDSDIRLCSQLDQSQIIPELNRLQNSLLASS